MLALAIHNPVAFAQFVTYGDRDDPGITYTISISPASPRPPIMHHRLLPPLVEQFPGNAAPLYYRAILAISQTSAQLEDAGALWEQLDEWRVMPLEELPVVEIEKKLELFETPLREAAYGARRTECDWDLPLRESGKNLYGVHLSEIQEMRTLARIVAVRARLRLAQGRLDDAIYDLQTGYAMARHVGNRDFLVNALVGIALASLMDEQLLTALSLEKTPNLYWSITELPDPLIDPRAALETERDSIFTVFPELKEVRNVTGDKAYWDRQLRSVIQRVHQVHQNNYFDGFVSEPKLDLDLFAYQAAVISQVPRIKHELKTEMGYDAAEVDPMPGSRALLLYAGHSFERVRDAHLAPQHLPFHLAQRYFPETRQVGGDFTSGDPLQLDFLIPSIRQFQSAVTRKQRMTAMLRAVEALRDHAQRHGELPAALDQINGLPVPEDPFTGKPFLYSRSDEHPRQATLEGERIALANIGVRIRLELRLP